MSEKQHNTENRMNDSYQSLEQAIKKAIPLLGMLPEDDYVIGDFDLLPTIDGEHFWNGNYNNGNLCHAKKYYISGGFIPFDSPMCLFPSERASLLSSERIEYYKERLSEGNHYPRAIAYYISGGMTVLLDGHHKVTAAATIGQPIRCLVVMHANIQDREQAVSLNHNRNNIWSNGLQLFNSKEEIVGKILMVTERKWKQEQHTYWDKKENSVWESVPEEYCQSLSVYPNAEFLTEGMAIARNKIKTEFDVLRAAHS